MNLVRCDPTTGDLAHPTRASRAQKWAWLKQNRPELACVYTELRAGGFEPPEPEIDFETGEICCTVAPDSRPDQVGPRRASR